MKKIISAIILLMSFSLVTSAQQNDSLQFLNSTKFVESFIKLIQNHTYDKAYGMLSNELKSHQSQSDFILHYETLQKYYGKLISYQREDYLDYFNEADQEISLGYKVKFKKINGNLSFNIIRDGENFKLNFYHFTGDQYESIKAFDKICKAPLTLLTKKDYSGLFNLQDLTYSVDSFSDFNANIKKLELGGKMKYKQNSHHINVFGDVIYLTVDYEINGLGDIRFSYGKEGNSIKLHNIGFYFTKEIEN